MTVRAATSLARRPYRPDFWADSLMCSYWRRSLELTPRTLLPRPGIEFLLQFEPKSALGLGRPENVLPGLRRRADLLLGPVQHVLGFLADRADHLGGVPADPERPVLGVLTDLLTPIPDGEPSDERSEDESKHRRPPFF